MPFYSEDEPIMPADKSHLPPASKTSSPPQAQAWDHIVSVSDHLMQLAQQKDWDAVAEHHERRDQLLEEFFSQAVEAELVEKIRADIARIVQQDTKITQWVQNNRDELGEEAQRLRSLRQRAEKYGSMKSTDQ